jgi:hypothetical protein
MAAIVIIAVLTVGLAILLGALLPGAGLLLAIAVVLLGLGLLAWLVFVGASGRSTTDLIRDSESRGPELLGPGGQDDPKPDRTTPNRNRHAA